MKKRVAVISGGDFSPLEEIESADYIIACDKGYRYAVQGGITPDLLVGDFDSYQGELPPDIPVLALPREKDDTDTMAAIRYALEEGCRELYVYCALGGRLDHLCGNIQAAAYAVKQGARVKITGRDSEVYLFGNDRITLPRREAGNYFSLISLTDTCEEVCIRGAKYPLEHAVMENASTLGISNEWVEDVTISVGRGVLMVICSAEPLKG